jgi:DNA-binding transcriptional LysR family regulator
MLSGSMTGAARPLSLIQPVVSKIISQLELEIGFSLFDHMRGKLHWPRAGCEISAAHQKPQ